MKKILAAFIFVFFCLPVIAQKNTSLFLKKDSIIPNVGDVVYIYTIVEGIKIEKVLYSLSSSTIEMSKDFEYKNTNRNLRYTCFSIYDQPTGRSSLILFNHNNKRLYKSEWFDDNATGDSLVKSRVNFVENNILIKEAYIEKYYKVGLSLIELGSILLNQKYTSRNDSLSMKFDKVNDHLEGIHCFSIEEGTKRDCCSNGSINVRKTTDGKYEGTLHSCYDNNDHKISIEVADTNLILKFVNSDYGLIRERIVFKKEE
jgi:hypothetical protein